MSTKADPVSSQTTVTRRARAAIWGAWIALLVPTLIVAGLAIAAGTARIAHTMSERTGVLVIGRLGDVISAAGIYRTSRGGPAAAHDRAAVDAALADVVRLDRSLPPSLAMGGELTGVVRTWTTIRRKPRGVGAHLSAWIERLLALTSDVSDRSSLTYDPGNDTLNLGDALAIQYRTSSERFARLAIVAARTPGAHVPLAQSVLIARLETEALDSERLAVSDISEAVTARPELAPLLRAQTARVDRDALAFGALIDRVFVQHAAAAPATLGLAGRRVVAEQEALKRRIAVVLDAALAMRVEGERRIQVVIFALTAVFIIISFAIVAALIRGITTARELEHVQAERARERELGAVQHELRSAEEKFRVTFEQTPVGILIVDEDLRTYQANPALEALVDDVGAIIESERASFTLALSSPDNQRFERSYPRRDDRIGWAEVVLRGVADRGDGPRFVLGTFRDVTESKALASRLVYEATHDALTGLPNRMFFNDALRERLERSTKTTPCALLFIDLDDFKAVNDNAGHHAGDAVLVATANRLRSALRDGDIVCRFAGDEFAIVLRHDSDAETEAIARRIIAAVGAPLEVDDARFSVRASIGIVVLHREAVSVDDALRAADTAMYRAKTAGGGRYVIAGHHEEPDALGV